MYTDDVVVFSDTAEGLQNGLNCMYQYCQKWKLSLNTQKSKVMVFKKDGKLRRNTHFYYGDHELEIVSKFTYLGIVFSTEGAFTKAQQALSGQSLKATFMLNKYIRKFVNLKPQHILYSFDKLIWPILTYSAEIWGVYNIYDN